MDETMEQRLMRIIESAEIQPAVDLKEALAAVEGAFPDMESAARETMAKYMVCGMPSPTEIERAERMSIYNKALAESRKAKLEQRKARKALGIKPKRNRRGK